MVSVGGMVSVGIREQKRISKNCGTRNGDCCYIHKPQKVFQMKTSACRDGTLKNQPNKMGTTPQHIYTIPTSCAILPTMLCVC